MIRHQILLSSSYSEGSRICLDFPDCNQIVFKNAIGSVNDAYDGKRVSFSLHTIHTDSVEWGSVVEKDPYFDDVHVVETVDEFVKIIQNDRYLKGMDVAKYILSKESCTHARIEGLTFICYADYLCSSGKRLFEDKIYAYQHGPVIDSVYQTLKKYSKDDPKKWIDDEKMLKMDIRIQMRSRILFSEDGEEKMASIDRTLSKYKGVSTEQLVDLIHQPDSPWQITRSKQSGDQLYQIISDDAIKEHHRFEQIGS